MADKEEKTKPKYGVEALAEALNTKPHLLRIRLRRAAVKKNGKTYGWDTKSDFDAVVTQLKSSASSPKTKEALAKDKAKAKAAPKKVLKKAA